MNNINLEFSGNLLRVLQISSSGEILLKNEIIMSFNINDEIHLKKNKSEFADEFSESFIEIINNNDTEFKTAGILIGSEQAFLNVTPIDFNEDKSAISSHILWELSNYFPDSYKDFNIKYYRLHNNQLSENIDDVLLIAINKKKLEFIRSLCDSVDIRIKNVEIDHFVVEKYLNENFQGEISDSTVLVIGCKNERLDFSLIEKKILRFYSFDIIERSDFKNSLIRQISFLNSYLTGIQKTFLYGDESSVKVRNFITEQFQNLPVSFLNLPGNNEDSRFSPLYGLALKNI